VHKQCSPPEDFSSNIVSDFYLNLAPGDHIDGSFYGRHELISRRLGRIETLYHWSQAIDDRTWFLVLHELPACTSVVLCFALILQADGGSLQKGTCFGVILCTLLEAQKEDIALKFLSVRDLRGKSAQVWKDLPGNERWSLPATDGP